MNRNVSVFENHKKVLKYSTLMDMLNKAHLNTYLLLSHFTIVKTKLDISLPNILALKKLTTYHWWPRVQNDYVANIKQFIVLHQLYSISTINYWIWERSKTQEIFLLLCTVVFIAFTKPPFSRPCLRNSTQFCLKIITYNKNI